ncbi:helix-turn-helix domain-containing protein [Rhodopila globiformis]|nr:helix-turn-helix domain-containing protein [Rhodopila globiformis]
MMSTVSQVMTEPPSAVRAGADLREARERLGWPLPDVAAELRIRLAHLEALEDGRVSDLPGAVYAVAFTRSYARLLGLDAEEMVRRFKAEVADVSRRTELVFPIPMPDRGFPAGAMVLLGLVLAVGAYTGWYRLSGEGRLPAETVTAIPERLAPLAEQALPPVTPPATAVATAAPNAAPAAATAPVAEPVSPVATAASTVAAAPATSVPSGAPSESTGRTLVSSVAAPAPTVAAPPATASGTPAATPGAAPVMAEGAPPVASPAAGAASAASVVAAAEPPVPAPSIGSAQAATLPPGASDSRIVLHATADAWLLLKDRSGSVLLNRVLKAGESWSVPPRSGLLLTTGNAGGTQILVDGAPTPSIGGSGVVRRDMPLDPQVVKDGKLATALLPASASRGGRQ